MYRNKGTITVFLSLISMLFLSLFCTMAESVRVQAARFQAAAAFDMGLFSVFGEYDRVLLEEYDLWFLDGSSEERKIREVLETKLEKYIQPNINPRYHLAVGRSWDVFPTELVACTVDKYALATDHGGQVFYSQAVENQKELFVGEAAAALKKNIKEMEEGHQKGEEYQNEEQKADEEYQRAQTAQMEEEKRQESEKAENKDQGEEQSGTDIKETEAAQKKVENPLDQIKKIKSMGILGLVVKDGTQISDKTIERKNLPSERTLQKGSLPVDEISADAVSEAVFLNYLRQHFQCATDKEENHKKGSKEHSLSYELEYIIGGQKSDRENLKKTVNRILLIREGMNYATLAKSAKMRGEAMALATAITGAAALPELAGAVQKLLMLAWAYGESLLDVRTLLAKGKVPMLKTEAEWKLPLEKLGMLTEVLKECDAGGGSGQSYEDYLAGLLISGKKQQRNLRVLDLIECNRRMEKGGETFQVDALVAQAEASADFELAPVFLRVPAVWMQVRNQGTSYTVKGQYGYEQP